MNVYLVACILRRKSGELVPAAGLYTAEQEPNIDQVIFNVSKDITLYDYRIVAMSDAVIKRIGQIAKERSLV